MMIVKVVHIYTANGGEFTDRLRSEIAKMQNECGLEVEVQYRTASGEDGYNQYVVYSALVIGREIPKAKGGE